MLHNAGRIFAITTALVAAQPASALLMILHPHKKGPDNYPGGTTGIEIGRATL